MTTRSDDRPLRSRLLTGASIMALGAVGATGLLAGCRDRVDDYMALTLSNPETRHPIAFSARRETLEVEVPSGAGGLSEGQEADVYRFIARYRAEGQGQITVSTPGATRAHLAARRTAEQIRNLIAVADIPTRAVQGGRHGSGERFAVAVQLSFERPVAIPPTCGDWSADAGVDRERLHMRNFGCATQHNLAVTVANPRDLLHPQEEAPRSAERRAVSWSQYTAAGGASGSANAPGAGGGDGAARAKPAAIK